MSTPEDRWLRETFDDAVADVSPHRDLADVRARIEADATHARRRRGWTAGAAGLAVAATVAAVALVTGFDGDDDAAGPATSPTAGPTGAATGPTHSEPSGGETAARFDGPLAVYYVGDTPAGPRLFREFEAPATERGDPLATAVQMAVSRQPDDPDYRIPWPDGVEATASMADDLLTVDLRAPFVDVELVERRSGLSRDEARIAIEQLIHTAQAAVQERAPVRFLIDGRPTDRLLGEPAAEPLTEGDPMQVQAPVWIIDPQDGTALNSLAVQGRGAFFEANVSWQVLQDGAVVEDGFATAQQCCTLSPYSFEVPDLAPGDYVLRVYDADMSGGEGPGEHEDTKRFTLTG